MISELIDSEAVEHFCSLFSENTLKSSLSSKCLCQQNLIYNSDKKNIEMEIKNLKFFTHYFYDDIRHFDDKRSVSFCGARKLFNFETFIISSQ